MWMRSSRVWMRSSWLVRVPGYHCQSRNSPGFNPSILRHSGIWGAADEAVLNNVHKKFFFLNPTSINFCRNQKMKIENIVAVEDKTKAYMKIQLLSGRSNLACFFSAGHKEIWFILADQHPPRIWAQMRGGGGLRGLSEWVQLCTWSPYKLWRSNSIVNQSPFSFPQKALCTTEIPTRQGSRFACSDYPYQSEVKI